MAGLKIKKGDRVIVLSGKDKGKEGVVHQALPSEGKVVVEGVNTAKRHRAARSATDTGGIIHIDKPIDVSNVAVISPSDGMDKTAVVTVITRKPHPRYRKTMARTTRLYVHDEENTLKVGDKVRVAETRPLSKLKRWRIVEILERAK